jgi:hypothetical protein
MRDRSLHGEKPKRSESPTTRVKYGLLRMRTEQETFTDACGVCDSRKTSRPGTDWQMCPHCDQPPFCAAGCPLCRSGMGGLPDPHGGR